ncbi:Isy1-like splicing factor [Neolentinus lepideus HHB14362 ss-1]|uniref:Isy1-like splicing factor n=1 Tax=Neolentinus lepideus HHB14362 ss-1 TaxID=1314782 RepID=A0A165T403_9AGAM|nr:Isy1-like splicing factor [Neolentinus lepideus HHB14362 ss-1]
MARNEEKAQSMLYRFREAQAAELGLGTRADRRPRMASSCKSLRECERWRGEILREISRKVSKIQDSGLTDYEVRDLNDEINKLMREKRHWENQIVALGGANYRRNVPMMDDDGREVPGTKGYKYFGRAKDLPGVRELFQSKKLEEDEENQIQSFYKRFTNQGPAYYGDLDEADGSLLKEEQDREQEEWEEAYQNLRGTLGLPTDAPIPPLPRPTPQTVSINITASDEPPSGGTKRKDPEAGEEDVEIADGKRSKTDQTTVDKPDPASPDDKARLQTAVSYIPFLSPEHLLPPKLPGRAEMEAILLDVRKRAVLEEYFG